MKLASMLSGFNVPNPGLVRTEKENKVSNFNFFVLNYGKYVQEIWMFILNQLGILIFFVELLDKNICFKKRNHHSNFSLILYYKPLKLSNTKISENWCHIYLYQQYSALLLY